MGGVGGRRWGGGGAVGGGRGGEVSGDRQTVGACRNDAGG